METALPQLVAGTASAEAETAEVETTQCPEAEKASAEAGTAAEEERSSCSRVRWRQAHMLASIESRKRLRHSASMSPSASMVRTMRSPRAPK